MNEMERMRDLVARLNAAAKVYYQGEDEIMTNFEYDALYDELVALEEKRESFSLEVLRFKLDMKPLVNCQKKRTLPDAFAWKDKRTGRTGTVAYFT